MRRIRQSFGVLALLALAAASVGAGSAAAATQGSIRTKAQWQAAIAHVRQPGKGCYHAAYPALQWHAVTCTAAPRFPLAPARSAGSATRGGPMTVGNGHDYSAVVTGLISQAVGTFNNVSAGITERGKVGNAGLRVANAYSLQLNTQFFSGSPACSGSSNPANCLAWQQFVYTYQNHTTGYVYMQYWLINYNATCPAGWFTYSTDCYTNSSAATTPGGPLTAADLATLKLTATAVSGGNDGVSLSVGGGTATAVTNSDSEIDLASSWNTTEWGVFGDGGGGEAYFGTNTTLEPQTVLTDGLHVAPRCVREGFTAETNNLKLTTTPALGTVPSPTMASEQTNGTSTTASCARKA